MRTHKKLPKTPTAPLPAQPAIDLDHQALLDLFTRSLGQPAARPGLRLRSERELAVSLGVSRARVAWVIGKLAQQGTVARRTGSGTFLRHVTSGSPQGETIDANRLFTSLSPPAANAASSSTGQRMTGGHLAPQAQLKIGVGWLLVSNLTHTNRLTLDGMVSRAQELGHTLTYHNFGMSGTTGLEQAIQMLSRHRFDGLLLCAIDHIPGWINTATRAVGQQPLPRAFFYTASVNPLAKPAMTPAVTLDDDDAASQAVALLAGQGYREIGLISLYAPRTATAYDHAMRDAGLSYRKISMPGHFTPLSKALNETDIIRMGKRFATELMDGTQAPDALYVADDILMLGVAELLEERGLTAGAATGAARGPGIISLANMGGPLPAAAVDGTSPWSVLMMDPTRVGRLAIDLIVDVIQNPASPPANLILGPRWCPGVSHLKST